MSSDGTELSKKAFKHALLFACNNVQKDLKILMLNAVGEFMLCSMFSAFVSKSIVLTLF